MLESVAQFIRELGRDYLLQSHATLVDRIHQGCIPVKYEELRVDFNSTMSVWLHHWGVRDDVIPRVVALLQNEHRESYDGSGRYSESFIAYVNGAIDAHDRGSTMALVVKQAGELGYAHQEASL